MHRPAKADYRRRRGGVLALAGALVCAFAWPPTPLGGTLLFRDGFEVCAAGNWHFATGLAACAAPLDCPAQPPGSACISGQLFDLETSARICTVPPTVEACPDTGAGGPCALELHVYDALALFGDPTGTPPLGTALSIVDGCGRFLLSGFTPPGLGFAAVTADDAAGVPDSRVTTVVTTPIASQQQREGIPLFAMTHATDEAWTMTAGFPFGPDTFADRGLFLQIFLHGRTPVAGVRVTLGGAFFPDDDYYFSDSEPGRRSVVDAAGTQTGLNGSGMLVESNLGDMSGSGSEPPGCEWRVILGDSAPALVVVHENVAAVAGDPDTDCP